MSTDIIALGISQAGFAPFGDLIDADGDPDWMINQGLCGRYHDRGQLDFGDGRAGVSLFNAEPRELPLRLEMVERHPAGSQCFIPMAHLPFLVIVATDLGDRPGQPQAFTTKPGQAINFHKGTWHGVLTPLNSPGLFAVIDRIGDGNNLDEHWFDRPYTVRNA